MQNIYNIPAGVPFADCFAKGILKLYGDNPALLAKTRIYLPSRRGIRTLRESFTKQVKGKMMFLPILKALGDEDASEISLLNENADMAEIIAKQYQILDSGTRQLALTKLILEHIRSKDEQMSYSEAFALSASLLDLLASLQSERIPHEKLLNLDVGSHAAAWQENTKIIQIITDVWPVFLKNNKLTDPTIYRNAILESLTRIWKKNPPETPVFVAGSTGSMPASADFMKMVSNLPKGAVILPGFDPDMNVEDTDILTADHPQYGLCRLIKHCNGDLSNIPNWHSTEDFITKKHISKRRFFHEIMRPSQTSEAWQSMSDRFDYNDIATALDGMNILPAQSEAQEATAIALILREALETPDKNAVLITPNRVLVRRVKAELLRWNIIPDDSAGTPLSDMPQGIFIKLLCDIFEKGITPISLLSLFKHPLVFMGKKAGTFKNELLALEDILLRGSRPPEGISGLREHLKRKSKNFDTTLCKKIEQTIDLIEDKLSPLLNLQIKSNMQDFISALISVINNITTNQDNQGFFWTGDAGKAMEKLCEEFSLHSDLLGTIPVTSLRRHLCEYTAKISLRPAYGFEKRISILGTPEARLQQKDIIILAGLTEGSWPISPDTGIWLSRTMRQDIGLSPPERRIGLSAHDFVQAACAPKVYISYAKKSDGTPLIPSRWMLRIENIIKGIFDAGKENGFLDKLNQSPYLEWTKLLDKPDIQSPPAQRPMPTPPVNIRPKKLSVTEIETWVRDPYAIYAKHILKLKPKEDIDMDITPSERGSIIHDIVYDFMKEHKDKIAPESIDAFYKIIDKYLLEYEHHPAALGFWRPRLMRIAQAFIDYEIKYHSNRKIVALEEKGEMIFPLPSGEFLLTARLDRMDKSPDNSMIIIDYKTSKTASKTTSQIEAGLAPQLPLQAIIAQNGGFNNIKNGTVGGAEYIILSGNDEDPYIKNIISPSKNSENEDFSDIINQTHEGFRKWLNRFEDEKTPYTSRLTPQFITYLSDYDHLARVKEWN